MSKPSLPPDYAGLLREIKDRIQQAQMRAVLSANAELVRPSSKKVPPPVAQLEDRPKVPPAVAQFPDSLLWAVPWAHHVVLIEKVKDMRARHWYMVQTLTNGWSRNVLQLMIQSEAQDRQESPGC